MFALLGWAAAAVGDDVAAVSLPTTGRVPSARYNTSATVATSDGGAWLYVYGGFIPGLSAVDGLFRLDLGTLDWSLVDAGLPNPGLRSSHALGFDPASGLIVLFGGTVFGAPLDDVYLFDPRTVRWTGPLQPTPRPTPRSFASLHYAADLGGFLLVGGSSGPASMDILLLRVVDGGVTWSTVVDAGLPVGAPDRSQACSGYDERAQVLYVAWGLGQSANRLQDAWRLHLPSATWTALPPSTINNANQACHWDPATSRMVVAGGFLGTLFGLNGLALYSPETGQALDASTRLPVSGAFFTLTPDPTTPNSFLFFGGAGTTGQLLQQTVRVTTFPDGSVVLPDAGRSDAGTPDSGMPDAGTPGRPDAGRSDAGTPDAGTPDAGASDAGTPDAGTPDAGTPDAGTPDAGTPDAGNPDAGNPDAGNPDAGTQDAGSSDTGPVLLAVGCGCGTGPGDQWLAVLLLLARRLREKRWSSRP